MVITTFIVILIAITKYFFGGPSRSVRDLLSTLAVCVGAELWELADFSDRRLSKVS